VHPVGVLDQEIPQVGRRLGGGGHGQQHERHRPRRRAARRPNLRRSVGSGSDAT
jgi:hypothetical protein